MGSSFNGDDLRLYFRMTGQVARDLERNATEKARAFADIKAEISEFGTGKILLLTCRIR